MPTNLQLDKAISSTAQPIKDQAGNSTPLHLSEGNVAVGAPGGAALAVRKIADPNQAHLQFGDPTAEPGKTSAKLTFSGFGIEHAGFAWVPDGNLANGKLHLTFGQSNDPSPRRPQPARVTFQANGHVGIGTTEPTEALEVSGNIVATGDMRLAGADCAEDFEVEESHSFEPGTVMIIGDSEKLCQCADAYDTRVAGVISGAGGCKPGIILGKQQSSMPRMPLALSGKVFCKVDAEYSPIRVGDLLTTSSTPGHAMRAADAVKAFGAVIGKALRPLSKGRGIIPILIALQ